MVKGEHLRPLLGFVVVCCTAALILAQRADQPCGHPALRRRAAGAAGAQPHRARARADLRAGAAALDARRERGSHGLGRGRAEELPGADLLHAGEPGDRRAGGEHPRRHHHARPSRLDHAHQRDDGARHRAGQRARGDPQPADHPAHGAAGHDADDTDRRPATPPAHFGGGTSTGAIGNGHWKHHGTGPGSIRHEHAAATPGTTQRWQSTDSSTTDPSSTGQSRGNSQGNCRATRRATRRVTHEVTGTTRGSVTAGTALRPPPRLPPPPPTPTTRPTRWTRRAASPGTATRTEGRRGATARTVTARTDTRTTTTTDAGGTRGLSPSEEPHRARRRP